MRVLVYVRASHDPEWTRASVERQRCDCLSLVEIRGWNALGALDDNDRSAYRGKQRPGRNKVVDRQRRARRLNRRRHIRQAIGRHGNQQLVVLASGQRETIRGLTQKPLQRPAAFTYGQRGLSNYQADLAR